MKERTALPPFLGCCLPNLQLLLPSPKPTPASQDPAERLFGMSRYPTDVSLDPVACEKETRREGRRKGGRGPSSKVKRGSESSPLMKEEVQVFLFSSGRELEKPSSLP